MPVQTLETGKFIPVSETTSELPVEVTSVKERLAKSTAIVLMDLDKTTIDESYRPTDLEGLQETIARLQDNGVLVGIHSDSPRETDIQFAEMFGANGPLVYEMAGVYFPWADVDLILDPEALRFFTTFRDRFYQVALEAFPNQQGRRCLITKERDRNKEKREGRLYPGYTHGIWVNPLRLLSFGLWAERIDQNGATYLKEEFHREVNKLARRVVEQIPEAPSMNELVWNFNPRYGVVIVKKKSLSSKTPPVQAILSLAEDYQGPVYMIGDSPADYIDDSRVTTLAVANAKQDLKDILGRETSPLPDGISSRIAQRSYTQGVIEHLNNIGKTLRISST